MKTKLTYTHMRNLFRGSNFRGFVYKYFEGVHFDGTESGNWNPSITITNWDEVKDIIPKSARPDSVQRLTD